MRKTKKSSLKLLLFIFKYFVSIRFVTFRMFSDHIQIFPETSPETVIASNKQVAISTICSVCS